MFRFISLLGLSLALHFISAISLNWVPSPKSNEQQTVLVELVSQTTPAQQPEFEKPVVKNTTETPASEMQTPSEFVAEKNQRFEKQTKAEKLGVFKNRTEKQNQKGQKKLASNSPKNSFDDPDGVPEFAKAMQNQISEMQASSVPFELPDSIAHGSTTNLNADAHIYASFYDRVIELFYVRWAEGIEAIGDRLSTDYKRQMSGKSWTTDLEIWLNAEGIFQKGFITKKSGFTPFDQAGVAAFKNAQFFPNPPKAKVESDGLIRLRYRIRVITR